MIRRLVLDVVNLGISRIYLLVIDYCLWMWKRVALVGY